MTAHSRVFTSFIAVTAVLTSGCVFTNTPSRSPGDITFTWTFNNGRGCSTVPDVTQIQITIPGQSLQNGGVYGCVNAGTAGIKLLNFRGGEYSYTVSGQNAQGQTLYTNNGSVTVDGDVATAVDLRPTSDAKGQAYITWRFPANTTIDCQTITAVDVSINGALIRSATCAEGFTGNGVFIPGITPGNNVLTLAARDVNDFYYYRSDRTLVVTAGNDVVETTTLDYAVGSLPVRWTFNNGVQQVTCSGAGVTTMNVNLRDTAGTLLYGNSGFDVPCTNANTAQGTVFPYLYSGTYELYLQAYGAGGVLYRTNFNTPPRVTVTAGIFPIIDTTTPIQLLTL
jgi:hypothetical protein